MSPDQALELLIEGNRQYSANDNGSDLTFNTKRLGVDEGQHPFAVILGCSDSRVPAELVFNRGLGDLFVIRVAGNVVAPSQIGSVEFACQHFGTRLVVVLGHSHCGVINATVDTLLSDEGEISANVASIVDQVVPAAHPILMSNDFFDRDDLIDLTMRANIEQSVNHLKLRSLALRRMIKSGQIRIVGAEYSIETGRVKFHLDD